MELLLRTARRVQGVTADEIAERLGYNRLHLRSVEAGRDPVTKRFRQRFIEVFGQEAAHKLLQPLDPSSFNLPSLRPTNGSSSNT